MSIRSRPSTHSCRSTSRVAWRSCEKNPTSNSCLKSHKHLLTPASHRKQLQRRRQNRVRTQPRMRARAKLLRTVTRRDRKYYRKWRRSATSGKNRHRRVCRSRRTIVRACSCNHSWRHQYIFFDFLKYVLRKCNSWVRHVWVMNVISFDFSKFNSIFFSCVILFVIELDLIMIV